MPVRQKSWGLPVRPPDRTATIKADENELEQQSSEAAVKYWLSEAEKLQPEQRLFERGAEADSYEDYVSDLTRAVQNTTNSSKVSRLSRKMKPVYALVKSVAPLVASADQASPFPSSLVIGGITCILSASNRVDDYQGKLIEKMEEMVDEIDSINQYRREGIFQDDPGIKACELNLATDIFQFCVRVAPIFYDEKGKERNGLSVAMKMQFKDFDTKFGDIMAHFKQHLRALENRRGLINNRWTKETHFGVKEMGLFMGKNSQDKKEAMEEKLRQQKQDEDNERAQRRKEFLDWLPFIDFGEFHDNAFERSVDGTGDWLTKNNNYKAWSDSSSSSMLWIRGKHGSGKSHLASCIIEKLLLEAKTAPGNAVAFVYCTTTQSKTEMTLNNLLGSLLRQICRQLPPSRDVKDLISKDDYSSKDSPRRSELKSGILKAISACHASSIIVDGLDECSKLNDSHFKEFCDFIASLVEKSGAVTKVIVLSRPNYGEIDKIMGNVSYIIDVDTGANHDDIERFVSQTISEINSESSQEELQDFEEIKSKLVNNASGMFLYVRLKVRDFGDLGNAEDIRASLEDTVEDLNDLYGQAINSVLEKRTPFRERALMALMWITNSRRPLSKMELLEALSLKLKRNGIRSSQRLKSDYQICRQCADLITETGGFYYLIHGSLEDYLLSNSVGLSEYRALQSQAHAIIAEACLSYLNFDDFQKNRALTPSELFQLQQQYPLLHYASSQWGGHYKRASLLGDRGSEIRKLSLELLSVDSLVHLCLKVINLHELDPEDLTPVEAYFDWTPTALHLICALDLRSLVESIPRCVDLIDHLDHIGWAPIQYALHFNSKDMCIWILDTIQERQDKQALTDELVGDRYCLLHYVVDRDWDHALRQLLSFNCDPDVRDGYGETPLHCAIQHGCHRSFEILLAAGADVTIESNDGTTPLIEAVDSGELKFVREILAKIADVARDPSRASPLNWKTQPENLHRHELIDHSRHNGENAFLLSCALGPGSMVELLLQHGANIKALNANSGGETGLHLACTEGHIDVVDVFLSRCEAPELVNAEDFEGYTPLYKTIFCQDLVIAIKLLEHGAQPNHVIRNKYTPLMLSIFGGAYEIAKALIVDYKVDALSQTHYDTPLHWAADVGWSQILKIIPNMSIWYQNQHRKHTPLHEAARQNQIEFMKEFIGLTSTANLIPLDESGGTPLHTAARGGALDAWQAISTSATYTAAHPFGTPVKVDMKTSSSIFLNRMPT
ncbi:putative Pfs NACHT and ankyrin-domain-containing protein [Colletotrichum scovillei]|nr:putative Pfs NACHT and ankyrin-domain-containing protein [Colletotrichum scovillei]